MAITLNGTTGITSPAIDVTTPITVSDGGTGATTLAANNVLLGNGTSALQVVAPGTSGNVLTSNGTTWQSVAPAAPAAPTTAQVLSATAGATFNTVGSYVVAFNASGASPKQLNTNYPGSNFTAYNTSGGGTALSGTYKWLGSTTFEYTFGLVLRVA